MHTVALAITDGTPLFELAIPTAIFGAPQPAGVDEDEWYDLLICAPPRALVGGSFRVETPHALHALATADTVIVPACHDQALHPTAELVDAIRAAHAAGARVASICTGAFVLAATGLLDGRRATTHWSHAKLLAQRYPAVDVDPRVLYIDDGDVLTSAGKAAGIDLCLHIASTDHGTAIANALARRLVTAPHRAGGQAQFIDTPLPDDGDHRLAHVMDWALANLDRPLTVEALARRAYMSPRHLTRTFTAATGTTPLQWLLHQRVHRAQDLLEQTDQDIETVADHVGMGTAATLRRHFHRALGVTPTSYRDTFHAGTSTAGRQAGR